MSKEESVARYSAAPLSIAVSFNHHLFYFIRYYEAVFRTRASTYHLSKSSSRWLIRMEEINAGGSRRKRKKCDHPPVEEDDADDESKMHKFFDLIHNLGQSLKGHGGWVAIAENNRDKMIKGGWWPRFEPQDFADDHSVAAVAFNDTWAFNLRLVRLVRLPPGP